MRIVFMGTPSFAVPVLQAIHHAGHEIACVITQPDRPQGRKGKLVPPEVKVAAETLGLPVLQFEKVREDISSAALESLSADVIVTAAYGQILSERNLAAAKHGVINAHASLLPKYRGSSPVNWAIIEGEKETGITTMYTAKGVDTGDMILQERVGIREEETAGELLERLSHVAAALMLKTLQAIAEGSAPRIPQQDSQATHCRMLKKEDGKVDFFQDARTLCNRVRGLDPWPGSYTIFQGQPLKLFDARMADFQGNPGEVLCADTKNGLVIGCKTGAVRFLSVQAPGKKRTNTVDYLRGHSLKIGQRFDI